MTPTRSLTVFLATLLLPGSATARTIVADPKATSGQPGHYQTLVRGLAPGDTLQLPAGVYRDRLNLDGLRGSPSAWIVISGPGSGTPAKVTTQSDCCNTVQLGGTVYVAIRNLTIDSGGLDNIDGINAKGAPTHDILVENCTLIGQGANQGTIGISTKSPAWRWTIRGNRIVEAGTGIYLGNSDGTQPFIAGVVEGNLILNSTGYNMEIKHQLPYEKQPWVSELPAGPHRTVIRNNVFIKERNGPSGHAEVSRPNLLVDPFPGSGTGKADWYEIYGNLFFRNSDESLFQGSGRIALHDNLFIASERGYASVFLTHHNGPLERVHVYNNTIYSQEGGGIEFDVAARDEDAVVGNIIVTGGSALAGAISFTNGNVVGRVTEAARYFAKPSQTLGQMDFYPAPQCRVCTGASLPLSRFKSQIDYDLDFNGTSKTDFRFRGAYAGQGTNPGWQPRCDLKPVGPGEAPALPRSSSSDPRPR